MKFGSTAITFIFLGVGFAVIVVCVIIWVLPLLVQRKRYYSKKKDMHKKVTEELVNNSRYNLPSIVALNQQIPLKNDYGSTTQRDLEYGTVNNSNESNELPSINITFEEDSCNQSKDENTDNNNNSRKFSDTLQLEETVSASKRRFSSIVFSHSDELKILSETPNLEVTEKRERRASMSLFDTCKLACPELGQDLNQSTEHLNSLVLQESNGSCQGKLYFSITQTKQEEEIDADNNGCACRGNLLQLGLIKVSDIVQKKQKKQYYLEISIFTGSNDTENMENNLEKIYENKSQMQICGGEVVNFDENFEIEISDNLFHGDNSEKCLVLVFELKKWENRKNKSEKIGEIRFDLLGLIEGQILCVDGQEKFVVCRNFTSISDKDRFIEDTGKIHLFLRFVKVTPMNLVIGIVSVKDIKSQKPYTGINVRVTLATDKKVLDTRKSRIIKLKHQNESGILKIDESFEFSIALLKSSIGGRETNAKLSKLTSEDLFITVFLCGRNNIGFSHVLGKCVLGPIQYADGYGLLHWTKSMTKMGDIHYHWHTLKKV